MSEINRRYFESLMDAKRLSLRGLAKEMGMTHSQLSLAFNGARRITLDEAAKLSRIFGEPLHKIVENAGVAVRPVSGRRVPVVGIMRGDGTVEHHGSNAVERTTIPDDLPDNTCAIQCRTTGSILDWMDGWVMFCHEHNSVDPAIMGRLCHAKIKDGPIVIATIRRGYREGTYNLGGPHTGESVELEWAMPVLFTRH